MRILLLVCAAMLIIAIFNLPIAYYSIMRIIVSIGAIVLVFTEFRKGINFWIFAFALVGIIFNPIMPVYLSDKSSWTPIDIIAACLFVVKFFSIQVKFQR
ncbi:MAG: hypothetical protein N4A49_04035 [Marinifilaceae bacterium]|jgi:hypothetical protein|nr:hypothetical protein [Marinifilaceae bacterium]